MDAADRNDIHATRLLLAAGWPVDARGKHGATALHFAAWHGNADLVRDLLAYDPSLDSRDRDFTMTPLGWALHGSRHGSNSERGDYTAIVEQLLSAGAMPPSGTTDAVDASEEVREVLRRWRQ